MPFGFVYAPELILAGTGPEIAVATLTALIGVVGLAGAVIGHVRAPMGMVRRVLLTASALALIAPGLLWDAVGLALLLVAGFARVKGTRG